MKTMMEPLMYWPRYVETSDTTEAWHDWLVQCGVADEPSELSTITDVCASARCKAKLLNDAGFVVGHVDANGDYRLGGQ